MTNNMDIFEIINLALMTISTISAATSALLSYLTFSADSRHIKKIMHNKKYDVIIKPAGKYENINANYFNYIDDYNEENKQEIKMYLSHFKNKRLDTKEIDGINYYVGNYDTSEEFIYDFFVPPFQFLHVYETKKGKRVKKEFYKNKGKQSQINEKLLK